MSTTLSKEAIQQYHEDGFTPAVRVISEKEAEIFRFRMQAVEAVVGELKGGRRLKCHLLYKWVSDLIRTPAVVDRVEDLLGANVMCWGTDLWVKEPDATKFVSWHQDHQYWGVSGNELLTAWIALSPATVKSGCMRMLPGSHRREGLSHLDTYHKDNMLTRGQTIFDIDEEHAVNIEVDTGEAVFFNYRIAHASHPNCGSDRRIGIAIRYIPPTVRQLKSDWDSASLIRGKDQFGHFVHEPTPEFDFDPVALEFHKKSNENYLKILYSGSEWTTHRT